MQGVAQQKRSVSIDITNHIKTFINPENGEEITREQLRGIKINPNQPAEDREQNEMAEEGSGGEVEEGGEQV